MVVDPVKYPVYDDGEKNRIYNLGDNDPVYVGPESKTASEQKLEAIHSQIIKKILFLLQEKAGTFRSSS